LQTNTLRMLRKAAKPSRRKAPKSG
jgi:hypothetical protein